MKMDPRRRDILKLMGLGAAAPGIGACLRPPDEQIVPYVHLPEGSPSGRPRYYATALTVNGYARGVLMEVHEGRPVKLEGNPDHPGSLGATDVYAQGALFELYDPDRRRSFRLGDQIRSRPAFIEAVLARRAAYDRGAPLTIVTGPTTSPTLMALMAQLQGQWPQLDWRVHQPIDRRSVYRATEIACGRALEPRYHVGQAKVLALFDTELCGHEPGALHHARGLAARRSPQQPQAFSRIHAACSAPAPTEARADEYLALHPDEVERLLLALAAGLQKQGPAARFSDTLTPDAAAFLDGLLAELRAHPGESLVIAGPTLSAEAQAAALAINAQLGAVPDCLEFGEPLNAAADRADLHPLPEPGGDVYLVDCDPAATAPADVPLADWLGRAEFVVHAAVYDGATAALAHWTVPLTHPLEGWSDARAWNGGATIQQPGIRPLYDGMESVALLGLLLDGLPQDGYERVREHWRVSPLRRLDDRDWQAALASGVATEASPSVDTTLRAPANLEELEKPADEDLKVVLRADPRLFDGRHQPNDWLQELPAPMTTQVWGNSAWLSAETAKSVGVQRSGQVVRLATAAGNVEAPALIVPAMPPHTIALHLGHGHRDGADAYRLRLADQLWSLPVEVTRVDRREHVIQVQHHDELTGRHPIELGSLDEVVERAAALGGGESATEHAMGGPDAAPGHPKSLYGDIDYDSAYRWGMVIDLNACIGCSVCTIACQAENNIPAVGHDEAALGRTMHWIRVDRYYGHYGGPAAAFQPVPCMHCEKAPCELVCPVAATVHDSEGLNLQIYNRCIGTRDCSQNCPYKVRRFNFMDYNHYEHPELAAARAPLRNPEVTVRERGVMEKCTYCLQRISRARIEAKMAGRPIAEGEVVTACQQACPTRAIQFGNLNDPDSAVAKAAAAPDTYDLLGHLDTRPRTRYRELVINRKPGPDHG